MVALLLTLACTTDVSVRRDTSADTLQERMGLTDAEVAAILDFLQDCDTTESVLDGQVGLDSDAAGEIVDVRDGPDGQCGTSDDVRFETLDDLDDIPQVGEQTIRAVHAHLSGDDEPTTTTAWEGVTFSPDQQVVALEIANEATKAVLDDTVGLASDEAQNIVNARPIRTMDALAAVPQVGTSALQKIKDHIPRWGG
ncbi:MAG: hypothetical protein RLZZ299_536 [Pseudomonadota bacterium]|jgi:DNA uptake protein ComE-like DNA-binding protein